MSGEHYGNAVAQYEAEVDHEAARLIRNGETPWLAVMKACELVSSRRRAEALKHANNQPPGGAL